jgi:hypothetical protein
LREQNTFVFWDFNPFFNPKWAISPEINDGFPYLLASKNAGVTSIVNNPAAKIKNNSIAFAGIKNGQINLNLKVGDYTAELYNLQGRMVSKVDINAINGINATGLRTDNLAKGIFILNVKQAGVSVLRQKINVKR